MSHPYASELHPRPDPTAPRVCGGCGCTDFDACLDPATGEACHWIEDFPGDLCSVCSGVLQRLRQIGIRPAEDALMRNEVYRDLPYVRREIERLAEQLAAIGGAS